MNMILNIKNKLRDIRTLFRIFESIIFQHLVLKRIRHRQKGQKIIVLFYVYDAAKWKCQSVYDLMAKSEDFEPIVAIGQSPYNDVSKSLETSEKALRMLEDYFINKGCRTIKVVNGCPLQFTDLARLKSDIIFIQQPWSLPNDYEPWNISRYALPMYVPYYVEIGFDYHFDCQSDFHRCLFRQFTLSEKWSEGLRKAIGNKLTAVKYIATGHPSLDFAIQTEISDLTKRPVKTIIYAPHFSFYHPKIKRILNIGTFSENGVKILEYAKRHREFNWIFKPHPALFDNLAKPEVWGNDKTKDYYDEWKRIGIVSLDGNYLELFFKADAMITDSASFLAEYGATGKPIIYLVRNHPDAEMPHAPDRYFEKYYNVHNLDEMYLTFKNILEKSEDPMREERINAVRKAGLLGNNAAKNIVNCLKNIFKFE